jgi:hypothetical protein
MKLSAVSCQLKAISKKLRRLKPAATENIKKAKSDLPKADS